jgi:hypothetical protein
MTQSLLQLFGVGHDRIIFAHADLVAVSLVYILQSDRRCVGLDEAALREDRNHKRKMELQASFATLDSICQRAVSKWVSAKIWR